MKLCRKCNTEKDLTSFNKDVNKHDGLQSICRECSNKKSAHHYANNKSSYRESKKKSIQILREYVLEYLLLHPCVDCGEKDPVVLDFDHVNGVKTRNIAEMIHRGVGLDTLKLEVDKCTIRCANCHRRKTAKDFNWFKISIK